MTTATDSTGGDAGKKHPADTANNKNRKPAFNHRTDSKKIGPITGMIIQFAIAFFGSVIGGRLISYGLSWITGNAGFSIEWENRIQDFLWVIWPVFSGLILWLSLDVRNHVKNEPDTFATMTIFGINLIEVRRWNLVIMFEFKGEVSCFKWTRVCRHMVGGLTLTIPIKGSFNALDEEGNPQPVYSKDGGDPVVEAYWASFHPFKVVRRLVKGMTRESFWSGVISVASSEFKQAASGGPLTMKDLQGSHRLNQVFMNSLIGIPDDEGRWRSFWVEISTGKSEWIRETDEGLVLYNPRVVDMGPHPRIQTARIAKSELFIDAQGRVAAYEHVVAQMTRLANGGMTPKEIAERAMLTLGTLNDAEFQIREFRLDLGVGGAIEKAMEAGIDPDLVKEILSHLRGLAQAVAVTVRGRGDGKPPKGGSGKKKAAAAKT